MDGGFELLLKAAARKEPSGRKRPNNNNNNGSSGSSTADVQARYEEDSTYPEYIEVGRNRNPERLLDHIHVVEAVRATLAPDPNGSMFLTGQGGVMELLNNYTGQRLRSGIVNAILRQVFLLESSQQNICRQCGKVCTRKNCASHYHVAVVNRNRLTVVKGVTRKVPPSKNQDSIYTGGGDYRRHNGVGGVYGGTGKQQAQPQAQPQAQRVTMQTSTLPSIGAPVIIAPAPPLQDNNGNANEVPNRAPAEALPTPPQSQDDVGTEMSSAVKREGDELPPPSVDGQTKRRRHSE